MDVVEKKRFRVSVRWLMVAVAVSALMLAPLAWLIQQQNERIRLVQLLADRNMALAERAEYAALQAAEATQRARAADQADHPAGRPPAAGAVSGLWAAIGVNHTAFRPGETKDLFIEFTLINDGATNIDPKIVDSRVVINGKDLEDSARLLGSEPRDPLPPGERLRFGFALGEHFQRPGVYRVSWRGEQFRSPEVAIRVLPEPAR
jgi:hypothetical protein